MLRTSLEASAEAWLAAHPRAALLLGVGAAAAVGLLTLVWCMAVGLP